MSKSSQDLSALTFDQFIKSLRIIHIAMVLGSFLMIIVTRIILGFDDFNIQEINYQYAMLGLLAVISAIFIGKKIATLMKNKISSSHTLESKITLIQGAITIEYVFSEIPIMFCVIIGFMLNEFSLTVIAALSLIYLWSIKPDKSVIIETLQLKQNERSYVLGNLTLKEWNDSLDYQ